MFNTNVFTIALCCSICYMYVQEMRLYPQKHSAGNRFYFSHRHVINMYCSFSHKSLTNLDQIQHLNFAYNIHITSDPEILEEWGGYMLFMCSTPQNH